jgi:hypothetical protein
MTTGLWWLATMHREPALGTQQNPVATVGARCQ